MTPSPLPVRNSRYRRPGRHSSPHQLSLPSDAPALVLAVPGAACPESDDIAAEVAAVTGAACTGAQIWTGYLSGQRDSLTEVLSVIHSQQPRLPSVIVPLMIFPHPDAEAGVAHAINSTGARCLVSAPLGPHPLTAEALHQRLADAGLARAGRVGRIATSASADGLVVGAEGGPDSYQAASVIAVLLASRLTMPVVPAALADVASLKEAAEQLRAAGVIHSALAPCVIGPELPPGMLAELSAETGLPCAAPLGGHPAVAKLVAVRYGAALEDPRLAGLANLVPPPAGPPSLPPAEFSRPGRVTSSVPRPGLGV